MAQANVNETPRVLDDNTQEKPEKNITWQTLYWKTCNWVHLGENQKNNETESRIKLATEEEFKQIMQKLSLKTPYWPENKIKLWFPGEKTTFRVQDDNRKWKSVRLSNNKNSDWKSQLDLYNEVIRTKNEWNKEKQQNIEKKSNFDITVFFWSKEIATNPATPTLKRLLKSSVESLKEKNLSVWEKDINNIYTQLDKLNPKDDVITNLTNALDNVSENKPAMRVLSKIIISIWNNNDSRLNETKEWKKTELPKEFKENKLLENPKYERIASLLAKNYISFPDNEWNEKFNNDLALTIETTANKIIAWKKDIPTNKGFTLAMKDIHSESLETRLGALKYIDIIVNTKEWSEWIQSMLIYKNWKKNKEKQDLSIEDRFNKLKERANKFLKEKNNKQDDKVELIEEIDKMKKEAIEQGEVFIASDLDKIKWELDSDSEKKDPLSSL